MSQIELLVTTLFMVMAYMLSIKLAARVLLEPMITWTRSFYLSCLIMPIPFISRYTLANYNEYTGVAFAIGIGASLLIGLWCFGHRIVVNEVGSLGFWRAARLALAAVGMVFFFGVVLLMLSQLIILYNR